jgi:hypothetical protein
MYQGLSYEIAQVMPEAVSTGRFVSLCTFSKPPANAITPDGGQAPLSSYTPVSGLVNIPCMDAVESSIQATEIKGLQDILSKGLRHMLLNGYYPESTPDGQIPTSWIANVDGIVYDVIGVEHDSQNQQTRVKLQIVGL